MVFFFLEMCGSRGTGRVAKTEVFLLRKLPKIRREKKRGTCLLVSKLSQLGLADHDLIAFVLALLDLLSLNSLGSANHGPTNLYQSLAYTN